MTAKYFTERKLGVTYIYLTECRSQNCYTQHVTPTVNLDFDRETSELVGIEILDDMEPGIGCQE